MISVGIENNVNIAKLFIDEQYGSLRINLARLVDTPAPTAESAEEMDEFEAMMQGGTGQATAPRYAEETNLTMYPVKPVKYGNALSSSEVAKELVLFQATLRHMLVQGKLAEQYNKVAQKDKAKFLIDFIKFPKTIAFMKENGFSKDTAETKLQDEALVEEISKQYFLEAAELLNELEVVGKPLRALLVRQSQAKHYPKLREAKFGEDFFINSPVFEREDLVPQEKSKLKFSKYEMEKGLNSGEKLEADVASTSTDVNALFGEGEMSFN